MEQAKALASALKGSIGTVIKGKDDVIEKVILCLLSGGHVLLEDVPGTGKTTLAKALAASVGLSFSRVQFTPDLLPSDLTGVHFFDQKEQTFVFRPGPIFTNILLADEINRATPRTQASLLECMEEAQVSIDGDTMPLDMPFFVIATQNPIEIQGTFPLPEAQLDRFLMRLSVGYPAPENEREMLSAFSIQNPLQTVVPVAAKDALLSAQAQVKAVHVSEPVKSYILQITAATRENDHIRLGVSPRGSLSLMRAAQAAAACAGREYVLPDDVKAVCTDVLCHRILCKAANYQQADTARELLRRIMVQIPVPAVPR